MHSPPGPASPRLRSPAGVLLIDKRDFSQRDCNRHYKRVQRIHCRSSLCTVSIFLLAASIFSSQAHAQLNLGCFPSVSSSLAPTTSMPLGYSPINTDIYMSHGACSEYCKSNQYRYAFAFGGTACYCSNERPSEENKVEDANCRKPCAGYPLEMCGSPLPLEPTQSKLQQSDNQNQADKEPGDQVYANAILIGNTLPLPKSPLLSPPIPVPVSNPTPDTITKITSTGVRPEERQEKGLEDEKRNEKEDEDDEDEGEILFFLVLQLKELACFKYQWTILSGVHNFFRCWR